MTKSRKLEFENKRLNCVKAELIKFLNDEIIDINLKFDIENREITIKEIKFLEKQITKLDRLKKVIKRVFEVTYEEEGYSEYLDIDRISYNIIKFKNRSVDKNLNLCL